MIPPEIGLPGTIVSAELIADRRGSRVWRVVLAGAPTVALKHTAPALLAERELFVLRQIGSRATSMRLAKLAHGSRSPELTRFTAILGMIQ